MEITFNPSNFIILYTKILHMQMLFCEMKLYKFLIAETAPPDFIGGLGRHLFCSCLMARPKGFRILLSVREVLSPARDGRLRGKPLFLRQWRKNSGVSAYPLVVQNKKTPQKVVSFCLARPKGFEPPTF